MIIINIKNRFFYISRYFGATLFLLLTIIAIGFLVWTSDRGLDISDEGIYLMASQFPMEIKIASSASYIFTSGLYTIAGHSVFTFRLLGLLLMLASASFLFWGLYRLLKQIRLKFLADLDVLVMAWSTVIFGAILYYAIMLSTPSYNLINSVVMTTASGFLFLGLSLLDNDSDKYKLSTVAFLGTGLCIGIALFVKITTGVSLFFLFSIILLFWPRSNQPILARIKSMISVGIGVMIWLFLYFGLIQSPASWWLNFSGGIENALLISPTYGLENIQRYYVEISDLLAEVFHTFWKFYALFIATFGVLFWLRKLKKDRTYFPPVLLMIFFVSIAIKSYTLNYYLGGEKQLITLSYFYFAWIITFLLALILTVFYQWQSVDRWPTDAWSRLLLMGVTLLLLPFSGLIGTGNNITLIIIFYIVPWFGLFMMSLIVISSVHNTRLILGYGAFIIVLFAFVQVIYGGSRSPYRLNTGILEQTVVTEIGMPSTSLKLDPATSDFFRQIHEMARVNGFKPGDDVLAFCNMAGVVFSLGGKSPHITHFTSGYKGSRAASEIVLSSVPKERIRKAFILQNALGADGFPDLTKFGIDFPSNYVLCGEAIWPYNKDLIKLWKPK